MYWWSYQLCILKLFYIRRQRQIHKHKFCSWQSLAIFKIVALIKLWYRTLDIFLRIALHCQKRLNFVSVSVCETLMKGIKRHALFCKCWTTRQHLPCKPILIIRLKHTCDAKNMYVGVVKTKETIPWNYILEITMFPVLIYPALFALMLVDLLLQQMFCDIAFALLISATKMW